MEKRENSKGAGAELLVDVENGFQELCCSMTEKEWAEFCGSSEHWIRSLFAEEALTHTVGAATVAYVKGYVQGGRKIIDGLA